ncbi:hypothetical protein BZA77DRAFT_333040 [Pyronema omphalodes]|nr:hypothetical protein BZA77DRAFT_333040 [Pyronema omphalodes]
MATRKIWVKRANGSPTAVQVGEQEMVDDVRDLILAKYQNTLGRHYDAPDIQIHIQPRQGRSRMERGHGGERMLSPDETLFRVIDEYYPGGQTAEDALIIVTDGRRTPRPSPGHAQSYTYGEGHMPQEMPDYFGQAGSGVSQGTPVGNAQTASALSVGIGQLPPMPRSPGGRPRPRIGPRMNTASPTLLGGASASTHGAHVAHAGHPSHPSHVGHVAHSTHSTHSNHSGHSSHPTHVSHISHNTHNNHNSHPHPQGPVVLVPRGPRPRVGSDASNGGQTPVPAALKAPAPEEIIQKDVVPSPVRVGSPPATTKPFKKDKNPKTVPPSPAAALHSDGAVPPIKVLIVEDNVINLRLLEAFMKRLKVRWEAAMNGKIAVDKWRAGGFHLVLMDIQLPVMNGLEATKEIRRLEKVNRIRGAFPHTANRPDSDDEEEELIPEEIPEADRLPDSILFRSPVIIVALTASSLVSDRHEAYAAGCNDFLTKPVNFIWLERKVTEWGCMQALIDFDGWKTWKKSAEEMTAQDATNAKNKRLAAGNKPGKKAGKGLLEEKK